MKKIFGLFTVCVLFLLMSYAGCVTVIPDSSENENLVAVYNNEIYDFQNWSAWNLIDETAEWEEVHIGLVNENEINAKIEYTTKAEILKNDFNRLVIKYGVLETNYYMKRGTIPSVYSNDVEKVVLSNEISNATLKREDLSIWLNFLKQCYSDEKSYQSEEWDYDKMGTVSVYFIDFPMYYNYGYIGMSKSGRLGFSSQTFNDHNTYCIILPEDLSNRILRLGYL